MVGERSLHENFGGEAIMSDQIDHLAEMSQWRNITLRIVPAGIGFHPGLISPFDIYDFPDAPPIASVEHVYSTAFLHEHEQTAGHRQVAKLLKAFGSERRGLAGLAPGGRPVTEAMVGTTVWRKSSYSGHEDNCVEVALGPVVGVRDTKARRAGQLTVSARAWRSALDHAFSRTDSANAGTA